MTPARINLVSLAYLFFRLAPFVVVCFFALSSLFAQDLKGVMYLAGLLLTALFAAAVGNAALEPTVAPPICRLVELGEGDLSAAPLGLVVLAYSLGYLLLPMVRHQRVLANAPTLVFFPALILADLLWSARHDCYSTAQALAGVGLGVAGGVAWAAAVGRMAPALQYLAPAPGADKCDAPSKSTFRCRVYKNGRLVGNL